VKIANPIETSGQKAYSSHLRRGLEGRVERLGQADLQATLDFLAVVGTARHLEEFVDLLVGELPRLIPSDIVSYNEVDPEHRRAYFRSNPADTMFAGSEQILERYMDQNPLVVHHARTGDGAARTWSDFITQRQLHSTDLYNELFRRLEVEREMVATLPAERPLLIGIVVMRGGRDFSDRDRAMLDLLRPHLANAYTNALARAAVQGIEPALPGETVVVLGPRRRIAYATQRALELLRFFGPAPAGLLPERLEGLTATSAPIPSPQVRVEGDEVCVTARMISSSALLLREKPIRVAATRLRSLGLSRREGEVLTLVAQGDPNAGVASRLVISERTVKKHLETIYQKLGVRSRTQAVAVALDAADGSV